MPGSITEHRGGEDVITDIGGEGEKGKCMLSVKQEIRCMKIRLVIYRALL